MSRILSILCYNTQAVFIASLGTIALALFSADLGQLIWYRTISSVVIKGSVGKILSHRSLV